MSISDKEFVVGMVCVDYKNPPNLLVVSEKGYGKRSELEDYRVTKRGGKGVKTLNVTEKTGKVVRGFSVAEGDDVMLMTSGGQSIRIKVSSIRQTGRVAQGVKLLTLKEGELLQEVAKVVKDDDDSEEILDEAAEGAEGADDTESKEDTNDDQQELL